MSCVVQLWLDPAFAIGKGEPFILAETEFDDFAAFLDAADADRLICVSRLDTRWGEVRGERVVYRRVPIAFRGSVVKRAELPTWRITELEV